ncbi:MAG: hypothetical protein LBK24_01090, partial [Puniceicoccales bacterium]|nr:hypothetical protein [Puniceicoccales bacterium]
MQKTQNPLGASVHAPMENTPGTMPTEGKYKDAVLGERGATVPPEHVSSAGQIGLAQQIIPKICSVADGVSMILDANGFKIAKDVIDLFSNITRYVRHVLSKSEQPPNPEQSSKLKQLFTAYFYNIEKKEIVFKKLASAVSSMCKVILGFAPQLTHLRVLSKIFPHVSLVLDTIELLLNYKNFTKDGLTIKNISKIVAATSYHLISSAAFTMAGGVGVIGIGILVGGLFAFFNLIASEGMKDIALIIQPMDKLLLKNELTEKLTKNVYQLFETASLDQEEIQHKSNCARIIYLSAIGLKLCVSAAHTIIKFISDSRKIP